MKNRTYTGVTRADVDQIRSELGKFGIAIPEGDDVEVAGPLGVRMQVKYDEQNQSLDLEIIEKPGYVSETQIWKVVEMSAGRAERGT
jgi:hypothetical protein